MLFDIIYNDFVYLLFCRKEYRAIMKQAMTEIVGNKTLCQRLISDVLCGSLSHAYIIEGASGSGRKTIALYAAAATACERLHDDSYPLPCCECPSCKKILERKSPDVIFIKDENKTTVGVDVARFIRKDVRIVPNDIEDKFYVIEEADKLTEEAQNALLLTLEEPPSFAHFFLICNSSDSFLETIRSRAITLRTQRLSDSEVEDYICKNDVRAAQMRLSFPTEFKELIKASGGGIGRAISYLDPEVFKEVKASRAFIHSFIAEILSKRSARSVATALSKFSSSREAFTEQLSLLSLATRDLILLKKSDSPHLEFFCDENEAIELSESASLTFLFTLYENIDIAMSENRKNANIKLLITKFAVNSGII